MTHTEVLESLLHIGVILMLRSATESYQMHHTWTELNAPVVNILEY